MFAPREDVSMWFRLLHSRLMGCLLLLLLAGIASAERDALHQAMQSIQADELQGHVEALADDTFEGREAGTRGGRAAAGYLTRLLEATEGKPAGTNGGFAQPFGNGYRNLLVYFEGSDPQLKDQVVVIGGHYDHVGYGRSGNSLGPAGYIHNGADDNASGVATMLEMIDAIDQLPQRPRRSILFAFWDAEERGLLGAKHWARRPTIPMEKIVYYINLDMVGRMRNNRLMIFGTRTGSGARRFVSEMNERDRLQLDFSWELKENSDHWPFVTRNVPVLMPHTDKHADYHRPSDDPERINATGMEQGGRLTFALLYQLAMRDEIPSYRSAWRYETEYTRRQSEKKLADYGSRLGVAWDAALDAEGPIRVTRIAPYSSAAKAGLKNGDVILGVGSYAVTTGDDMRAAILAAPGDTSLRVQRDGNEPIVLPVTLSGKPIRVGLSWRHDEAEPDVIFVSRVVSGSAADRAGVAAGDRVYSLNGRSITADTAWYEAFVSTEFPMELVLERDGRLRTATLDAYEFETLEPLVPNDAAASIETADSPSPTAE